MVGDSFHPAYSNASAQLRRIKRRKYECVSRFNYELTVRCTLYVSACFCIPRGDAMASRNTRSPLVRAASPCPGPRHRRIRDENGRWAAPAAASVQFRIGRKCTLRVFLITVTQFGAHNFLSRRVHSRNAASRRPVRRRFHSQLRRRHALVLGARVPAEPKSACGLRFTAKSTNSPVRRASCTLYAAVYVFAREKLTYFRTDG